MLDLNIDFMKKCFERGLQGKMLEISGRRWGLKNYKCHELIVSLLMIFASACSFGSTAVQGPVDPEKATESNHWQLLPEDYQKALPADFEFVLDDSGFPQCLGFGAVGHVLVVKSKVNGALFAAKFYHEARLKQWGVSVEHACEIEEKTIQLWKELFENKLAGTCVNGQVLIRNLVPGRDLAHWICERDLFGNDELAKVARKSLKLWLEKQANQKLAFGDLNSKNIVFDESLYEWVVIDSNSIEDKTYQSVSPKESLEHYKRLWTEVGDTPNEYHEIPIDPEKKIKDLTALRQIFEEIEKGPS